MHRAALTLVLGLAALPAHARDGFDGTWSVELTTESGLCQARTSTALAVRDGQIRPAPGGGGTSVSGRVGADGSVGLTVSNGAASGSASGRLGAEGGAGTWRVSALCAGRWTARRRATRTAQAE